MFDILFLSRKVLNRKILVCRSGAQNVRPIQVGALGEGGRSPPPLPEFRVVLGGIGGQGPPTSADAEGPASEGPDLGRPDVDRHDSRTYSFPKIQISAIQDSRKSGSQELQIL